MSELPAPLQLLLKCDVPWAWFLEHDTALTKLKSVLGSTPVLRFYVTSLPITLQVDASNASRRLCQIQRSTMPKLKRIAGDRF